MNLLCRGIFLFLFLLAITPSLVKAQDWEYGVSIGTSGYMGDYNQDNIFKFNSLAGSVGVKYNFNPTWGVRGGLSALGVRYGSQKNDYKTISEFSILPEFNFFKFEPNRSKNAYTPYVFAGIGARLDDIGSQGKFKDELKRAVVPFGAGFKYNMKGGLSIDSQLSYRVTADHNLDGYASSLPIKRNEERGESKVRFIDKINATDSYMTFQVGITYMIFKQGECPKW